MSNYPILKIPKGATAIVTVDLTGFDFEGGFVALTIKKRGCDTVIFEHNMDTAEKHTIVIPDELTARLEVSSNAYYYDIMHHIDNERFPQCKPTSVIVVDTVGGYINE